MNRRSFLKNVLKVSSGVLVVTLPGVSLADEKSNYRVVTGISDIGKGRKTIIFDKYDNDMVQKYINKYRDELSIRTINLSEQTFRTKLHQLVEDESIYEVVATLDKQELHILK